MNGFDISSFEDLLLSIKSETASLLLADLMDDEKRTPQLYNAIIKFLEMNKSHIMKYEQQDTEEVDELQNILDSIPEVNTLQNVYHFK
ncbi:TPA: DNA packaging protein [Kluyvera georgiana]|uniref:DNA packaging protein n=1 Tax=Kluyvera georgiana TaxID=73098 RepID=UPI003730A1A9